jgi:hypothetical protein
MENASIGDDVRTMYEFEWDDRTRTTEEIGDLAEAGLDCTVDDIVDVARDDPDCDVRIIGFEQT